MAEGVVGTATSLLIPAIFAAIFLTTPLPISWKSAPPCVGAKPQEGTQSFGIRFPPLLPLPTG